MEHSEHFPNNFYRVTVKGFCVRDEKLLLVQEVLDGKTCWDLPGGGLDFGEDFESGLRREFKEEMNLVPSFISKNPIYTWTEKVKGQGEVEWFYVLVLAFQVDFDTLDFHHSDECQEVTFFSQDELSELATVEQLQKLPEIFDPADFPRK